MSIQTELTRIKNAKAAIKAAIEGKGVTVPDGTLLDGMAALIDSIEAGGGSGGIPTPFTKFATGTFLLSSLKYANALPITHGLGVAPKLFLIITGESGYYSSGAINHLCYIDDANTKVVEVIGYADSKGSHSGWVNRNYAIVDENTFTFNGSSNYFGSNRQYRWVAIA